MLNTICLEKINNIYQHIKDECSAIYWVGSGATGLIEHPNDIDLIYMPKTEKDVDTINFKIKNLEEYKFLKKYYNTSIISAKEFFFPDTIYSYSYIKPILLFGEDVYPQTNFIEREQEYKEYISGLIINFLEWHTFQHKTKIFYRSLIALYIFKNKSYTMTEEQKKNINILHDYSDMIQVKKLIQNILDWLEIKNPLE